MRAVGNTVTLAVAAAMIGFTLGLLFGLIAGYFRDTWVDKVATSFAIAGVSVPHYWLGMVLVIIFAVELNWLPAGRARPRRPRGRARSRRLRRLGVGLGASALSDPAGDHHVRDPDGHHHSHSARADRRYTEPGLCRSTARQGPARDQRVPSRDQERGADGARRDGPAIGLYARRLDPDRDRVLLAGLGPVAQLRDFPARPAAAAGHDPGIGAVLRDPQPSGRYRSEEHTSELQSLTNLVCRLLLEKKKKLTSVAYNTTKRQKQRYIQLRRIHPTINLFTRR